MKPRQVFYDESQYANTPMRSYWEHTAGSPVPPLESLSGGASYEVAIIGGGYTGLSTALHLARGHGNSVCVLECGHMGWGASGATSLTRRFTPASATTRTASIPRRGPGVRSRR